MRIYQDRYAQDFMEGFGAKFIGTLDIPSLSIRTWDNAGKVEDIATGSLHTNQLSFAFSAHSPDFIFGIS